VKVHFAAGTHPFDPPWRNVDIEGHQPGITDQADLIDGIPDHLTGITEAYVGHTLEHFTQEEGVEFLTRLLDRMVPGGRLTIVGPDAVKGEAWFKAGRIERWLLDAIKAHGQIPEHEPHNRGAVHLWDCTGAEVVRLATLAGWERVEEFPIGDMAKVVPGVPIINTAGWQFAVVAYAPLD
jgi:hypothetical protein